MLQTLKIENVALIDKAILNFDEKLNVITGETGAGKSIMLDSLSFVFGGRADKTLIREGANYMKVDAIFTNISEKHIKILKEKYDISCENELFLSRELDIFGKNICKINGDLVPVNVVKKICLMLVDIHGQSEHLAILDNDYQLKIIDLFDENIFLELEKLNVLIEEYKQNETEIKLIGGTETEKQNLIDLYSYQINEIESANIKENEYESLVEEKNTMSQFEKINNALNESYQLGCKNSFGDSAVDKLNLMKKSLQTISKINSKYSELFERVNSSLIELEDVGDTINNEIENAYFDQERFNYVDERIDLIKSLFRKYGEGYEKLNNYYIEIQDKLDILKNSEQKYKQLVENREKILEKIENIQQKISSLRKISAEKLQKNMENELKSLGMPNAKMDIQFMRISEPFSSTGFDRVEYMFSSNIGFELKPLNKVVSGGEMSRVMLAYKIVVSQVDDIHTIVFDEIDSGLSGNIAYVVAQYMARLCLNKQIIAVSHLPQICAMADRNIKVEKTSNKLTTNSHATILSGNDLNLEIARLMGADNNETGINASKNLKERCDEYKNGLKKVNN